jgi:hypothetical protein
VLVSISPIIIDTVVHTVRWASIGSDRDLFFRHVRLIFPSISLLLLLAFSARLDPTLEGKDLHRFSLSFTSGLSPLHLEDRRGRNGEQK